MWNPFRKHCTDAQLLARADGELGLLSSTWVKAHLELCWDCRARMAELESQIRVISTALHEDSLIDPNRLSRAKSRFQSWRLEYERSAAEALQPIPLFSVSRRSGVVAGLCAAAFLVVMRGSLPPSHPHDDAADVLARTAKAEADLFG